MAKMEMKALCPECDGERTCKVIAHHTENWEDEGLWGQKDFYILSCAGCETVFFRRESTFSEDWEVNTGPNGEEEMEFTPTISYWPSPSKRTKPDWLDQLGLRDDTLYRLAEDIYTALDNDLGVLAAIGMRTNFDRASELLKIDTELTFENKLESLLAKGFVGQSEHDTLSILTDAGNAAAHRAWRPSLAQLNTLMSLLEQFLYRNFVLNRAVKALKPSIPPKKKRRKKKSKPTAAK